MSDIHLHADTTQEKIVAYFDFDGTLTVHDTLISFVKYAVGLKKIIFKIPLLLPYVLLYLLKIIDNSKLKQKFLMLTIAGIDKQQLEKSAYEFANNKLDNFLNSEVFAKLEYHLEHKHTIVIVSANLAVYLRYWAKKHNIHEIIATELEIVNNKYTGRLSTKNCYAIEKINRINLFLLQKSLKFSYSYAYGNSAGDYELLNSVNEAYWVNKNNITPWQDFCNKTGRWL